MLYNETNNFDEIKTLFPDKTEIEVVIRPCLPRADHRVPGGLILRKLMVCFPIIRFFPVLTKLPDSYLTQRVLYFCSSRKTLQFSIFPSVDSDYLRQDVTTRWNSTYLMFDRFVVLKPALLYMEGRQEYKDHHKYLQKIKERDWAVMGNVVIFSLNSKTRS